MTPGEDSVYEWGGDARRKFWIKLLKETDLGVAQAFLTPKRDEKIYISNIYFYIFSCATLNETFTAKYDGGWRFAQNTVSETEIRNLHP